MTGRRHEVVVAEEGEVGGDEEVGKAAAAAAVAEGEVEVRIKVVEDTRMLRGQGDTTRRCRGWALVSEPAAQCGRTGRRKVNHHITYHQHCTACTHQCRARLVQSGTCCEASLTYTLS